MSNLRDEFIQAFLGKDTPLAQALRRVKEAEDEQREAAIRQAQDDQARAYARLDALRSGKTAAEAEKPDVTLEQFKAGGKGPLSFPRDHVAAMRVNKGGSSCSNCKFVDAEAHACKSAHYVKWNGGEAKLPDFGLDEICSDWWEPQEPFE